MPAPWRGACRQRRRSGGARSRRWRCPSSSGPSSSARPSPCACRERTCRTGRRFRQPHGRAAACPSSGCSGRPRVLFFVTIPFVLGRFLGVAFACMGKFAGTRDDPLSFGARGFTREGSGEDGKENRQMGFTVAIDGPRRPARARSQGRLAEHYGLAYLDTCFSIAPSGAWRTSAGLDLDDRTRWARWRARWTGRSRRRVPARPGAGELASRVAIHAPVRAALTEFQRGFARRPGGAVLDGREHRHGDLPAGRGEDLRHASAEVRARRARPTSSSPRGGRWTTRRSSTRVRARDERDSGRAAAPLKAAPDAALLDTSELDIEEAFRAACRIVDASPHHGTERRKAVIAGIRQDPAPGGPECVSSIEFTAGRRFLAPKRVVRHLRRALPCPQPIRNARVRPVAEPADGPEATNPGAMPEPPESGGPKENECPTQQFRATISPRSRSVLPRERCRRRRRRQGNGRRDREGHGRHRRRSEGRGPRRPKEFGGKTGSELKVGDTVEVYVERIENALGEAVLSRDKARARRAGQARGQVQRRREGRRQIFNQVKGGFTVDLDGAVAFLPRSQVDIRRIRDVGPLMNTPQPFQILKMDKRRGKHRRLASHGPRRVARRAALGDRAEPRGRPDRRRAWSRTSPITVRSWTSAASTACCT